MKKERELIIGLGSNIGDRKMYLQKAISEMEEIFNAKAECSPIYESESWGFESENHFLNCCVVLKTDLSPNEALIRTKAIEKKLGRVKKSKNSVYESRVIDLDILYFGDVVLETENLTIPHPLIYDRMFAIRPVSDVFPSFVDPVKKVPILDLLALCNDESKTILYKD